MPPDTFNVDVCVVTHVNEQFPALMTSIFFSFVYSWAGELDFTKSRAYRFQDPPGMLPIILFKSNSKMNI